MGYIHAWRQARRYYRRRTAFVFAFVDPFTKEPRLNKWRHLPPHAEV